MDIYKYSRPERLAKKLSEKNNSARLIFIFNHQTNATIIKIDFLKKIDVLRLETETHLSSPLLANLAKGNMAEFLIDKHHPQLQIGFRYT